VSADEDPFGIPRHLGYSGERIRRTRGGRKSDSDPDYCAEEDASERQLALYFLYNAVDESGFEKIANVASSKEAWVILEVAYKNDQVRQVRLQALRGEFEGLKMEDKE